MKRFFTWVRELFGARNIRTNTKPENELKNEGKVTLAHVILPDYEVPENKEI